MPHASQHYVRDLGLFLKEKALDAKLDRDSARGGKDEDLNLGRLMAFYEVLSLMQDQAAVFDLDLAAIGLEGFNLDAELL